MKLTIDVDCTPAEARAFFGLPNMEPVNDIVVKAMIERTKENIDSLSDPRVFWGKAMQAGGQGMEAFNAMMAAAMGGSDKSDKKD